MAMGESMNRTTKSWHSQSQQGERAFSARSRSGARSGLAAAFALALTLTACGDREDRDVVRVPEEREAIEIIDLLQSSLRVKYPELTAIKVATKDGQKTVWQVKVLEASQSELDDALGVLVKNSRPQVKYPGYDEMFSAGKLIPSETEDRARYIHAKEGELQNTLIAIPGVVDARVNIAMPKEPRGAEPKDKTPPSASVVLKFRDAEFAQMYAEESASDATAATGDPKAISNVAMVRRSVAHGVEGLLPENVAVMITVDGSPGIVRAGVAPATSSTARSTTPPTDPWYQELAAAKWDGVRRLLIGSYRERPDEVERRLEGEGGGTTKFTETFYQAGLAVLGAVTLVALVALLRAKLQLKKATRR